MQGPFLRISSRVPQMASGLVFQTLRIARLQSTWSQSEFSPPEPTDRRQISVSRNLTWKLILSPRVLQHPYGYMVSQACYWNHYALIKTAGLTSPQWYGYPSFPLDSSSPMTVSFTCKTWLVMRSSSFTWPLGSAYIPLPLSSVSSPKVGTGFYIIPPREGLPGSSSP